MLTVEQEACNYNTMLHIARVRDLLDKVMIEIIKRGQNHDKTKLSSPEVEAFTEKTKHIAAAKFDSPEYIQHKKDMEFALEHHYANNRHHPEYVEIHEIWADVVGYEGIYEVSNLGRVRSAAREIARKTTGDITKKELIRKAHITPQGYARLQLHNDYKTENKFVYSLVAEAFIPKLNEKLTQVNHKNGDKLDNRVENLEWVTPSQNLQHAYESGLRESNVKYVVRCNELDIVTFGCLNMEKKLKKLGFEKASAAAIHRCITREGKNTHLDLTFESWNIDEYLELNSSVNNMNIIDIIEMFCDWKAASERQNGGNIRKSIDICCEKFGVSSQLKKILINSIDLLTE